MPNRPPFTGIHEISTRSSDLHEGGGPQPPYGEDFIQRIVDVNWTGNGAVFVTGDVCCYIRAASVPVPTLEQDWKPIGCQLFGDGGTHQGSSYGFTRTYGPTFLMIGNNDGSPAVGPLPYGGLAMVSHDGFKWETGLHIAGHDNRFYDVVWDGSMFFVNAADGGCYSSADGHVWRPEAKFSFFNHCELPDGIFGYDSKNDQVIFPDNLNGLINCACTAYAGGIWLAGGEDWQDGSSITISSIDGGYEWAIVTSGPIGFPFDDPITTMVGAPISHFR